jgi:GGDEF domain-containing protein
MGNMGSIAFLLLIIFVMGANLCLGFYCAVYFGYGPKTWPPTWTRQPSSPADAITKAAEVPAGKAADSRAVPSARPPIDALLTQLAGCLDQFDADTADWDQNRRGEISAKALGKAATKLERLVADFQSRFHTLIAPLAEWPAESPAAVEARDQIRAASDDLTVQFTKCASELADAKQASADLKSAQHRLTTLLSQVLAALHDARDRLEEPIATLVRLEVQMASLAAVLTENSAASFIGRLCFEHQLELSRQARSRTLAEASVVMIELNGLRKLNAAHGAALSRRAISAVGDVARDVLPPSTTIARLAGKQFVACLCEASLDVASELADRIRERVEAIQFTDEDREVRLTASAASAPVASGDTASTLLDGLRANITFINA